MKLATLKNGLRDGKLVVVSRDLTRFTDASFLVPTLQAALDDWQRIAPHLAAMAESLEHGAVPSERFHEHEALSPLPRAYRWTRPDGGPARLSVPSMRLRCADALLAPRGAILIDADGGGVQASPEVAVVTGDVPRGVSAADAAASIRLLVLANPVGLPASTRGGSSPDGNDGQLPSALSPVAATPDELGEGWRDGRLGLRLSVEIDGHPFGYADAGAAPFDFSALVAAAARNAALSAGAVVGSGPLLAAVEGKSDAQDFAVRLSGAIRLEMKDKAGRSVFGAIEQKVERHGQ